MNSAFRETSKVQGVTQDCAIDVVILAPEGSDVTVI